MDKNIMLICYQTSNFEELQAALEDSNISVTQVDKAQNAILSVLQYSPAFILLDFDTEDAEIILHEVSSNAVLNPPPYILIAASFSEGPDRATVLNLGADAFIEKPIDPQEIVALIHAVLRREHKLAHTQTDKDAFYIEYKDLRIYPLSHIVTMRGEVTALSPKEFDILHLLAKKAGTVLRKEEIYEEVWREQHECAASRVTDNIHSLRLKLGLDSKDSDYIQTVHSIGYRFSRIE